jgi:hypothetical protein
MSVGAQVIFGQLSALATVALPTAEITRNPLLLGVLLLAAKASAATATVAAVINAPRKRFLWSKLIRLFLPGTGRITD